MNTMEITKIVAGLCASLLVFLGVKFFLAEPLYHVGDDHGGDGQAAYVIEVEEEETEDEAEEIDIAALVAAADPAKGAKLFGKCKACHKLEADAHGVGPSLYAIVDRDIARHDGFGYSGALTGLEGDWTNEALFGFLASPKKYAPGTKMSFAGFRKVEDRAAMIAYLATIE